MPSADAELIARVRDLARRLSSLAVPAGTRAAADLRRRLMALAALPDAYLTDLDIMLTCGEMIALAEEAGAHLEDLTGLVSAARPRKGEGLDATAFAVFAESIAIAAVGRAASRESFPSRDAAVALRQQVTDLMDAAIERAVDRRAASHARALRELLGATVRDLTERGRPLARLVTVRSPRRQPSVVLAHRLYQDAARADEVARLNRAVHPAFMPDEVRVLSS